MPHSSSARALLRLVGKTTEELETSTPLPPRSWTPFTPSRPSSWTWQENSDEPLGNVLQKIAFLSPDQFVGLDGLARHILRSLEAGGRGLLGYALACTLAGAMFNPDYFGWMF